MLPRLARSVPSSLCATVRTVTNGSHKPIAGYWPPTPPKPPQQAERTRMQGHQSLYAMFLAGVAKDSAAKLQTVAADGTVKPYTGLSDSPAKVWNNWEHNIKSLPRPNHTYSGRSFDVQRDFNSAFKALQKTLAANAFVYELRLTERHEKKGAKRRRLVSERWRRRFAHEVRKKVKLVQEIRARGA
ncbi:hypothetical protein BXZ70DRAFT_228954 [Cristinia sonorae]|uniref:Uncharacterized protein n=1 Tax=Cristinia sonorae TaxID=1940300 RepID=A0A8K0UNN4_9AGAR|nr:hypothetical protein BXZ70DRAFT_228954 [Cristinia sonorae]